MEAVTVLVEDTDTLIYRHSARTEWGYAVIAWEREGKRGYRFEDGKLRVFTSDYWARLNEVDAPADRAERLLAVMAGGEVVTDARRTTKTGTVISLDDQVSFFKESYPLGFDDPEWKRDRRGVDAKRVLKRHRNSAIERAAEVMSESRLSAWIDAGEFSEAWVAIRECLGSTDMIAPAHRKSLRSASMEWADALVVTLRDLLYGDAPFPVRFDAWVAALRGAVAKSGSWAVATAPLALVFPSEHMCIKPGVISAQAQWLAPRLVLSAQPSAKQYCRLMVMSQGLCEQIAERGLAAEDLLDVYDFVVTTLKPKSRKEIEKRIAERRTESPVPTSLAA